MSSLRQGRPLSILCLVAITCGQAVFAAGPTSKPADKTPAKSDEPAWQPIYTAGGDLKLGKKDMNFSPRTAKWKLTLTTEALPGLHPNQDHSYVKLSLWVGEYDKDGHIIKRSVDVNFKKKGGAECVQEFSNGLLGDGTPRPITISINGTDISYKATIEDVGSGPDDQAKKDKPKK